MSGAGVGVGVEVGGALAGCEDSEVRRVGGEFAGTGTGTGTVGLRAGALLLLLLWLESVAGGSLIEHFTEGPAE